MRAPLAHPTLVAALGALGAACGEPAAPPIGSAAPPVSAPALPPGPTPAFPPLARPGEVYSASDSVYRVGSARHGSPLASRVVLHADGRFALQFVSSRWGLFEYGGRYARSGNAVAFTFEAGSGAGLRTAAGALSGRTLRVTFDADPAVADLVDGAYVRDPAP